MTGRCHSNPLISRAVGLWFTAHIWRVTSILTLSTGSARPVFMTSDMLTSGGSSLYGDHIGRQRLIAGRIESEQTPLGRDQNRRQKAQQSIVLLSRPCPIG